MKFLIKLVIILISVSSLFASSLENNFNKSIIGTYQLKIKFENNNEVYIFTYQFKEKNSLTIITKIDQWYKKTKTAFFVIENNNLYIKYDSNECSYYAGKIISINENEMILEITEHNITYNKIFKRI